MFGWVREKRLHEVETQRDVLLKKVMQYEMGDIESLDNDAEASYQRWRQSSGRAYHQQLVMAQRVWEDAADLVDHIETNKDVERAVLNHAAKLLREQGEQAIAELKGSEFA